MSGVPAAGPTNLDPYGPGGAGQRSRVPYPVINALRDSDLYAFKEWKLGPWSECSVTCGTGTKTRSVICVQAGTNIYATGCPAESKPTALEPCQMTTCPITTGHRCSDILDIAHCSIARSSGQCSLTAFRRRCCRTCED